MVKDSPINLEKIWNQVPVDYYQTGMKINLLQKIWHTNKLRTILDIIEVSGVKPKKFLDVGCASGWLLSKIAKKYPKAACIGVDVYKNAIQYGKKRYKSLQLIHADAHNLPFKDETFDIVLCTEVLEHVISPEKVLKEINRVLKDEGVAIIEMDTGNMPFRLIWYCWTRLAHGVWKDAHIHTFTEQKLEDMIKGDSFVITKKKVFNYTMAVVFCLRKI